MDSIKADVPFDVLAEIDTRPVSTLQNASFTARQLWENDVQEPASWLSSFLRPKSLTLVHAAPGTGKTPFTMQLCNAALGYKNLFNWRGEREDKARSCYYMDGELPLWLLKRNATANFHPDAQVTFFHAASWYSAGNMGLDLGRVEIQDALRMELERIKPDILVLDNRSNFYHGEENSNDDAHILNRFLIEIREQGAAILINHHQGKMGQSRGASAIHDVMDTVIRMDKIEQSENIAQEHFRFNIHFEKARMGWLPPRGIVAKIQPTGEIMMFDNEVYI